jgi:hypothetical protein
MPGEAYSNPLWSLPNSGYNWVPNRFAPTDAQATGFNIARIVRGRFYNHPASFPETTTLGYSIDCSYKGELESDERSIYYPIHNVFRPLANPGYYDFLPTGLPLILVNQLSGNDIKTRSSYLITLPSSIRVSAVTLHYSLTFDFKNESDLNNLTDEDRVAIQYYIRSNDSSVLANVDFKKYKIFNILLDGKVYTPKSNPAPVLTLYPTGFDESYKVQDIIFENSVPYGVQTSNYPSAKTIELVQNEQYKFVTLKLKISKFFIFEAANTHTNIPAANLPAKVISYAVRINEELSAFSLNSYTFQIPGGNPYRPTMHVKFFSPEYRTNSPGFSHGVNVRFNFASVPLSPVPDPLSFGIYNVTLLGISAGKKLANYTYSAIKYGSTYSLVPSSVYNQRTAVTIEKELKTTGSFETDELVGTFMAFNEPKPVSLSGGVNFVKGAFKVSFEALVQNNPKLINCHLYFRFWFAPVSVLDEDNYLKYRENTEICFKVIDGFSEVVRQNAQSYDDVIMSPPLSSTLTNYELARYVSFQRKLKFDSPDFDDAVLVMGVYAKTSTDVPAGTPPKIIFQGNTEFAGVETTIYQIFSGKILATKNSDTSSFTNSSFEDVGSPLKASYYLVGNRPIDQSKFYQFNKSFTPDNGSQSVINSFKDLVVLKEDSKLSSSEVAEICVPLTAGVSYPKEPVDNIYIVSDFVTDTFPLAYGQIDKGNWEIKLNLLNPSSTTNLKQKIVLEGLLINIKGNIVNRFFKSDKITVASDGEVKYKTKLSQPFIINGDETQFVLRLYTFPYVSTSTQDVTEEFKTNNLTPGFYYDLIEITKHTIKKQNIKYGIGSAPGFPGSVAYYEDLPLSPVIASDEEFYFIASDDVLGTKTVTITDPYKLTGTIYSPTWNVNLPKGTEIDFRNYFTDADILFRTVLGEGDVSEPSVVVETNNVSKNLTVVYTSDRANASSNGELDSIVTSHNQGVYSQYTIKNKEVNYTGIQQQADTSFSGIRPQILNLARNENIENKPQMFLMIEKSDSEGSYTSVLINQHNSSATEWITPPDVETVNTSETTDKRLFSGMQYLSVALNTNNLIYGLGYATQGSLVLKINHPLTTFDKNTDEVGSYLISGATPLSTKHFKNIVDLQPTITDPVIQSFPLILKVSDSRFALYYISSTKQYGIKCKILDGLNLSEEFEIFSFEKLLPTLYSNLKISGLQGVFSNGTAHIIFWCDSKIFYISTEQFEFPYTGFIQSSLQLLAGDFRVVPANKLLYQLNLNGLVTSTNEDPDEQDAIPQQKATINHQKVANDYAFSLWYKNKSKTVVKKLFTPKLKVSTDYTYKGL